jgi:hypothetical protein
MPTPSLADAMLETTLRRQIEAVQEAMRQLHLLREREDLLAEKARRLASQIDFQHDEMWVLKDFEKLRGGPRLGDGSGVQLLQLHGGLSRTEYWKPGPKIYGRALNIPYGTAIATFADGIYPNETQVGHAAIFGGPWSGSYDGKRVSGILIFDQCTGKRAPDWRVVFYGDAVSDRPNDAAAFSVILTTKPAWPAGTRIPLRH